MTGNHFGTVDYVGPRIDAPIGLVGLLSGNSEQAFQFHDLSHYAQDLSLTIDNSSDFAVGHETALTAVQLHAETIAHHVESVDAPILHVATSATHAHDFLI